MQWVQDNKRYGEKILHQFNQDTFNLLWNLKFQSKVFFLLLWALRVQAQKKLCSRQQVISCSNFPRKLRLETKKMVKKIMNCDYFNH